MTDTTQPEYTSTTGEFRAEHAAPFIGRKAIVRVTPSEGGRGGSTIIAGVVTAAISRTAPTGFYSAIYFQEGVKTVIDRDWPDSKLTITLIDEN